MYEISLRLKSGEHFVLRIILLLIREISVCYDRMMCIVYLKKEKEGNLPIRHRMNRFLLKEHIG